MKGLLVFFLFQWGMLNAFEFSWDIIHAKIKKPMAAWMEEQIEEDLKPFYGKKITTEDIQKTIREVYAIPSGKLSGLVHYQIKNNRISILHYGDLAHDDPRIAHVIEVLEDLTKQLTFPDMQFLAALWDSYDSPLWLAKTHCPVFTICKMKGNKCGVLFPEFRHFGYRKRLVNDLIWANERSSWTEKKEIAFWRGMSSGWNYSFYGWDFRPRARLALLSKERPDLVDAAFTSPYNLDDTVKKWMEHYGLFQPWIYLTEQIKYKYLIAIDGNTFASNLWWLLLSSSTVLKSDSDYLEWFYKGIKPHVHYVPYSLDVSDLEEKVYWLRAHDHEAKAIAEAGRKFAMEHLTNEDLMVYFYRVLLAYANCVNSADVSDP